MTQEKNNKFSEKEEENQNQNNNENDFVDFIISFNSHGEVINLVELQRQRQ